MRFSPLSRILRRARQDIAGRARHLTVFAFTGFPCADLEVERAAFLEVRVAPSDFAGAALVDANTFAVEATVDVVVPTDGSGVSIGLLSVTLNQSPYFLKHPWANHCCGAAEEVVAVVDRCGAGTAGGGEVDFKVHGHGGDAQGEDCGGS